MRRTPINEDVTIGRGGIAGGRFLMNSDTDPPNYIVNSGTVVSISISLGVGLIGVTLAAGASATDDAYNGMRLEITSGDANGAGWPITDYNGTTKLASIPTDANHGFDVQDSTYRIIDRNQ